MLTPADVALALVVAAINLSANIFGLFMVEAERWLGSTDIVPRSAPAVSDTKASTCLIRVYLKRILISS